MPATATAPSRNTRPDGKLLLQIGTRGKFDSVDGTRRGKGLNAARDQLHMPAGMVVDPGNGDIYVADGYGNRRIAVFDKDGKFLRQWGRQATDEETQAGAPGVFAEVVHCIAMSNAGLIYACDRQGNRVQVYQKDGTFVRNIPIPNATGKLPDKRGTAWWVAFSPDREQKFMYMMNGGTEQVHILDHASGKILSSFGRPGHQIGNFTHGHTIAVDSKGNIYVAETDWGRRVQKFKIVSRTVRTPCVPLRVSRLLGRPGHGERCATAPRPTYWRGVALQHPTQQRAAPAAKRETAVKPRSPDVFAPGRP